MNFNYPQQQFQQQTQQAYNGYRQMPQYPPVWSQPITPSQQIRPVSSIEEVRACPIDFDGSIFYFTDVANKKIYTKQINMDGTASINIYELKTDQLSNQTVQNNSQFVTRQEFEQTLNQLYNALKPKDENVQPSQIIQQQSVQEQKKPIFEI